MKHSLAVKIAMGLAIAVAFILGLSLAFPWDRAAELALSGASRKLEAVGVQLEYGSVRTLSHLPPRVEILDLSAGSPLGVLKAPSTQVGVRPVDSLFSLAPALGIESPAATLALAGTELLRLGRMQAELELSRPVIRIESMKLDGEFSITGWGAWSTRERRFTAADLMIKAPARLAPGLNLLALSTGLKPAGEGQWRMKLP